MELLVHSQSKSAHLKKCSSVWAEVVGASEVTVTVAWRGGWG